MLQISTIATERPSAAACTGSPKGKALPWLPMVATGMGSVAALAIASSEEWYATAVSISMEGVGSFPVMAIALPCGEGGRGLHVGGRRFSGRFHGML